MNKLFLLVVLITSMAKAQSFDFSCDQSLTGRITINGPELPLRIIGPDDVQISTAFGTLNQFDLTIRGIYTITLIAFDLPAGTKTININENGNQTLLWSEL